jgi:hypothetical protein
VRSELRLMEQLDSNLLFRWFVGLNTKNQERLLDGDIAEVFFQVEDGLGCEDGTQRQGSQAELQRKSSGGEPQRSDREHEVFEANGTAERDAAPAIQN